MVESSPTSAQNIYEQYGFSRPSSTHGNLYNSREFLANTINDIAMTLLNKDIEQEIWQRDVDYNDPSAQYIRLINAGMNPVLAMQAIAGIGNQAPLLGSPAGDYDSQNYGASRAAFLGNVISGARNIGDAALQMSQVRRNEVETNLLPSQIKTTQDMQKAQTWLARQQGDVVKQLANSESNAKDMSARLSVAEAELKRILTHQAHAQVRLMNKEFEYYDETKAHQFKLWQAEATKAFEEAKTEQFKRIELKSRSELNRNMIKVGDSQIALIDKQGKLISQEEFNAKLAGVEQRIKNMHLSTGSEYNYLGAAITLDWDNGGVFDSFGRIKNTKELLNENSPDYGYYNLFKNIDLKSYGDAHAVARQTVISGYINSGAQVLNAAGNVIGGLKGTPWLPSTSNVNSKVNSKVNTGF